MDTPDKPNFVPGLEQGASAPAQQVLPDECCAKCRFFAKPPEQSRSSISFCRRYPPASHIAKFIWDETGQSTIGNIQVSTHPNVLPQSWCGEYVPRDARMQ